jgi:hypothetical protein
MCNTYTTYRLPTPRQILMLKRMHCIPVHVRHSAYTVRLLLPLLLLSLQPMPLG